MEPLNEFNLEAVRQYMVAQGGVVTNHQLVKHFRAWLTHPTEKEKARKNFKDYVNTLAVIRVLSDGGPSGGNVSNDKYLMLKSEYQNSSPIKSPSDCSDLLSEVLAVGTDKNSNYLTNNKNNEYISPSNPNNTSAYTSTDGHAVRRESFRNEPPRLYDERFKQQEHNISSNKSRSVSSHTTHGDAPFKSSAQFPPAQPLDYSSIVANHLNHSDKNSQSPDLKTDLNQQRCWNRNVVTTSSSVSRQLSHGSSVTTLSPTTNSGPLNNRKMAGGGPPPPYRAPPSSSHNHHTNHSPLNSSNTSRTALVSSSEEYVSAKNHSSSSMLGYGEQFSNGKVLQSSLAPPPPLPRKPPKKRNSQCGPLSDHASLSVANHDASHQFANTNNSYNALTSQKSNTLSMASKHDAHTPVHSTLSEFGMDETGRKIPVAHTNSDESSTVSSNIEELSKPIAEEMPNDVAVSTENNDKVSVRERTKTFNRIVSECELAAASTNASTGGLPITTTTSSSPFSSKSNSVSPTISSSSRAVDHHDSPLRDVSNDMQHIVNPPCMESTPPSTMNSSSYSSISLKNSCSQSSDTSSSNITQSSTTSTLILKSSASISSSNSIVSLSSIKRRNSRAQNIDRRGSSTTLQSSSDGDTCSIATIDQRVKTWMVKSATADYHTISRLLREDPRLVSLKDFVSGYTALHWAAKHGNVEVIKLLVATLTHNRNGSSSSHSMKMMNAKSNGGYTPLHLACQSGHQQVFDLLVKAYGADPHIRDYAGKLPQHYLTDRTGSRKVHTQNMMDGNNSNGGLMLSMSTDTFRQLKDRRRHRKMAEKNNGMLRFGSISVRVKKTTEALNNYFTSVAPGIPNPSSSSSEASSWQSMYSKKHSLDSNNNGPSAPNSSSSQDSLRMPPPKFTTSCRKNSSPISSNFVPSSPKGNKHSHNMSTSVKSPFKKAVSAAQFGAAAVNDTTRATIKKLSANSGIKGMKGKGMLLGSGSGSNSVNGVGAVVVASADESSDSEFGFGSQQWPKHSNSVS